VGNKVVQNLILRVKAKKYLLKAEIHRSQKYKKRSCSPKEHDEKAENIKNRRVHD